MRRLGGVGRWGLAVVGTGTPDQEHRQGQPVVEPGLGQRPISRSTASEDTPNNNTIDSYAGLPVIEDEYP